MSAAAEEPQPDPSDYIERHTLNQIHDNAEKGDTKAQAALGYMYLHGHRLPQDDILAVRFLSQAASRGDPYASFQLGNLYLIGKGCSPSIQKAKELIKIAADSGDKEAQMQLADLLLRSDDPSKGVAYLTHLAELGDQTAMLALADALMSNRPEIFDKESGFKWYMQAAAAGNARGQLMAARCLYHGIGAVPDKLKATELYRKASEGGSLEAREELRRLGGL